MISSLQVFRLYFEYISHVTMSVTYLIQPSPLDVATKIIFLQSALSGDSVMSTHCPKPPVPRSSLSVLFPQGKRLNFIVIRKKTGNEVITYQ